MVRSGGVRNGKADGTDHGEGHQDRSGEPRGGADIAIFAMSAIRVFADMANHAMSAPPKFVFVRHIVLVAANCVRRFSAITDSRDSYFPFGSVTVKIWSAFTCSSVCTVPLGQVRVSFSTSLCVPKPKCGRGSPCEA